MEIKSKQIRFRRKPNKSAIGIPGLFFFMAGLLVAAQQSTRPKLKAPSRNSQQGQHVFASNCAGCHGLDGSGTQRAPNIVSNPQARSLSQSAIFRIVSEGVPGTGMPAFKHLGKHAIGSVIAYVRGLQGKNGTTTLPGDPKRGKAVFFGAGECGSCHAAEGRGGFAGPGLTTYGQSHDANAIKAAILDPASRERIQRRATVVMNSGERIEGLIRNEDNFSLQLQSMDGTFHLLSKSDLKTIERNETSMMPADYQSRLSAGQLNDLVSYLLKIAQSSAPSDTHSHEEE